MVDFFLVSHFPASAFIDHRNPPSRAQLRTGKRHRIRMHGFTVRYFARRDRCGSIICMHLVSSVAFAPPALNRLSVSKIFVPRKTLRGYSRAPPSVVQYSEYIRAPRERARRGCTAIAISYRSMVRPSDFAPSFELWSPHKPAVIPRAQSARRTRTANGAPFPTRPTSALTYHSATAASARAGSGSFTLSPAPAISHQFATRRRPANSPAYREPAPPFRPGSPPRSLRGFSTDEPSARWASALKRTSYHVCNPAQRSLSTAYGTSACDPAGSGWHSLPPASRPIAGRRLAISPPVAEAMPGWQIPSPRPCPSAAGCTSLTSPRKQFSALKTLPPTTLSPTVDALMTCSARLFERPRASYSKKRGSSTGRGNKTKRGLNEDTQKPRTACASPEPDAEPWEGQEG